MYSGVILVDEKSPLILNQTIQKNCPVKSVNQFLIQNFIDIAILNPHQISRYYTRPFALYFDLKDANHLSNRTYDFLIIDIHQAFIKFTDTYPEYWNEIKHSFKSIQYLNSINVV